RRRLSRHQPSPRRSWPTLRRRRPPDARVTSLSFGSSGRFLKSRVPVGQSVQQGTLRTVHRQLCGFRPAHAILASTRHPADLLTVDWGEIGTNTSEKYGAYRGGIQATSRESASFGGAYH